MCLPAFVVCSGNLLPPTWQPHHRLPFSMVHCCEGCCCAGDCLFGKIHCLGKAGNCPAGYGFGFAEYGWPVPHLQSSLWALRAGKILVQLNVRQAIQKVWVDHRLV